MSENELSLVKMPAGLRSNLTAREKRDLEKAERTIAKGLNSFLAVGMALKEIRDNRLYREDFKTFEEYCIRRWELSRPRAYELCAASEVVADLSANADIPMLPENEFQTRPLTRLKDPAQRRRAWHTAARLNPPPADPRLAHPPADKDVSGSAGSGCRGFFLRSDV